MDIVTKRLGEEVTIGAVKGKLTHFLVEKFLPHKEEYYLSIVSARQGAFCGPDFETGLRSASLLSSRIPLSDATFTRLGR